MSNGVAKVVLWCRPNDTFLKIIDFVIIFETQKMLFGIHQSNTYENSYKMTASEVMLWCRPNDNLVKIINFVKVIESGESAFGPDQVLKTDHDNKNQF